MMKKLFIVMLTTCAMMLTAVHFVFAETRSDETIYVISYHSEQALKFMTSVGSSLDDDAETIPHSRPLMMTRDGDWLYIERKTQREGSGTQPTG